MNCLWYEATPLLYVWISEASLFVSPFSTGLISAAFAGALFLTVPHKSFAEESAASSFADPPYLKE